MSDTQNSGTCTFVPITSNKLSPVQQLRNQILYENDCSTREAQYQGMHVLSSCRPQRLYASTPRTMSEQRSLNKKKLATNYIKMLQSQSKDTCMVESKDIDVRVLGRRRLNELSPLKVYDRTDIGEIDMGGLWLK